MASKRKIAHKKPAAKETAARHYDREAEARALRRYRFDCDQKIRPLGEVLDSMIHASGHEDDIFDRRALALISTLLDALDQSNAELPEGLLYSLHLLASGLTEIGARLEYAGTVIDNRDGCGIPGIDPQLTEVAS